MSNTNYVDHYIEILTATMQDSIIRNVSLQANARVTEQVINDQAKHIEEILAVNSTLGDDLQNLKNNYSSNENSRVQQLENAINVMNDELNSLRIMKSEFENTKHQVQHADTFRNELNKERAEHEKTRTNYEMKIKELTKKIDYLQLTPAQKKKVDAKKASEPTELKDGGTF